MKEKVEHIGWFVFMTKSVCHTKRIRTFAEVFDSTMFVGMKKLIPIALWLGALLLVAFALLHPALLLSLGGCHPDLPMVAAAHVADRTGVQNP